MSIDVIGDFLTIIRNGLMVAKSYVDIPCSNLKSEVLEILKNEGFIKGFEVVDKDSIKKKLRVFLKYVNGESVIHEIKRVSVPGRRKYSASKSFKPVQGGLGISIITTSKGLMTNREAERADVGGEVLCTVW